MNQGHAKPYDAPVFRVAAESKLSDVRAFFDSYAVQVVVSGYVYLEAPIHTCQFETAEPVEIWDGALPVVDRSIDVHLVPWWPPAEDDSLAGIRERTTRIPFFVEAPLRVRFRLSDQWWEFVFTPGKTYGPREIV